MLQLIESFLFWIKHIRIHLLYLHMTEYCRLGSEAGLLNRMGFTRIRIQTLRKKMAPDPTSEKSQILIRPSKNILDSDPDPVSF